MLERSRWKYGQRFARYVLLDAGHIAENVALAATGLGLGSCQIAAFYDEEAAALLGVDPEVEPVVYMTTLGYRIVPTIARVKPGFTLKLNTGEVDVAFEVPLGFLMDQANVQRHSRDWQGLTRHYYAITFGERYIWGVTAGILRNMHDRIYT